MFKLKSKPNTRTKSRSKSKSQSGSLPMFCSGSKYHDVANDIPCYGGYQDLEVQQYCKLQEVGKEKDAKKAVGDSMSQLQLKDAEEYACKICLQKPPAHRLWERCPFRDYVPVGAKIGSGYDIACCACHHLESEHNSESQINICRLGERDVDWVGYAIPRDCYNCGALTDHWTEECRYGGSREVEMFLMAIKAP